MSDFKESKDEDEGIGGGGYAEAPVTVPIEDSLDLHTFRPGEVKDLLDDYLKAALEEGFEEVRIIHGKGTGQLRQRVQGILERHPLVASFRQPESSRGGWGATVVFLKTGASRRSRSKISDDRR
jgi:dsDNA-specific endonuclease/ATPase MutS2